ncbi:MAG: glutamate racemase [Bacteroidaceae bacterium]|nr:glutamate racemase [Bacteroidaceae bacterium]
MYSTKHASFYSDSPGPIGIFDSGYGGLTILEEILRELPQYDYIYLGDNARNPYGTRSFEVVYEFTLQAVKKLFEMGCHLVILACNTASAKALRSIQQQDLNRLDPTRRVLGVIRPTIEEVGEITHTRHVGILATAGTIRSQSYPLEIKKIYPDIVVSGQACPMWVPLVENKEAEAPGADYFVKKYIEELMNKDPLIDTLILACTHYPILLEKIKKYVPQGVNVMCQGKYVAKSLKKYLHRHPEIEVRCTKNSEYRFFTTELPEKFAESATLFLKQEIQSERINL